MVVASAEGLDHDIAQGPAAQGGLGQVAILLLGPKPQAPRGAVRPRASAAPRVAILLAGDRPRGGAGRPRPGDDSRSHRLHANS